MVRRRSGAKPTGEESSIVSSYHSAFDRTAGGERGRLRRAPVGSEKGFDYRGVPDCRPLGAWPERQEAQRMRNSGPTRSEDRTPRGD
jgi:hypothetical protein